MIDFDPILVHEWLARATQRHPDKTALICGSERWTYSRLYDAVRSLAYRRL